MPMPMKPGVCCPPPVISASEEKLIPTGVCPGILAVDDHDAAGAGQHAGHALEAAAGGHRIVDHRVGRETGEGAVRSTG